MPLFPRRKRLIYFVFSVVLTRLTCSIVPALQEDRNLIISVSDQGVGISKEDQGRLFRSFERIENNALSATPGVGWDLTFVGYSWSRTAGVSGSNLNPARAQSLGLPYLPLSKSRHRGLAVICEMFVVEVAYPGFNLGYFEPTKYQYGRFPNASLCCQSTGQGDRGTGRPRLPGSEHRDV